MPKVLTAFECPEFLPIINNPGAKWGKPDSAIVTEDGGVTFAEWVDSPPVGLLPCDVWMVCFVDVALKKLPRWAPADHYGRLGIAFKDGFRTRNRIRNVQYYKLRGLEKDSLVREYNQLITRGFEKEKERVSKVLLGYRKPAVLWSEFEQLFAMLKITAGADGTDVSKIAYSRYETGYRFDEEHEARWVTDESNRVLPFTEDEVLTIIVPNSDWAKVVRAKLESAWAIIPNIMVYPNGA